MVQNSQEFGGNIVFYTAIFFMIMVVLGGGIFEIKKHSGSNDRPEDVPDPMKKE